MKGGAPKPAVLPCSCGQLPAWSGGTHECSGSLVCMGFRLCCQNCGTASEWRFSETDAADAWNYAMVATRKPGGSVNDSLKTIADEMRFACKNNVGPLTIHSHALRDWALRIEAWSRAQGADQLAAIRDCIQTSRVRYAGQTTHERIAEIITAPEPAGAKGGEVLRCRHGVELAYECIQCFPCEGDPAPAVCATCGKPLAFDRRYLSGRKPCRHCTAARPTGEGG